MLVVILFVLSGCASTDVADDNFTPTPVTFTIKVPYKCGQPPPIDHVIMRDIDWELIEVKDFVLDEGKPPFTGDLAALTISDYQLLGLNTSDWIAASKQLAAQRNFYRDCIVRSQKEVHDENLDAGLVPSVSPASR
jgi:hypothetical protein